MLLIAAILAIASHTSSVPELQAPTIHLRWLALAGFALSAVLFAVARLQPARLPSWPLLLGGALAALAIVSAAWSPYPRLTLERGGTFVVVLAASGALAYATAARRDVIRRLLATIAGSAVVIAILGFVVVAVDREQGIQGATEDMPVRLQGFGMNPNTASLLYALAAPILVWLALEASTRLGRAAAGAGGILVGVSLFASGSRGATLASFLGVILVTLAAGGAGTRRAALAGATVAVYVVGVVAADMRSLQPEFATAVKPRPLPKPPPGTIGGPALTVVPERGEELAPGIVLPNVGPVGTRWRRAFPYVRSTYPYDLYAVGFERPSDLLQPAQTGLFRGSGRLQVWEGAFKLAMHRPLLGYGFGLEEQVFVDRYYSFEGGRPENSYLGWLLQLGTLGTLVFAGFGVVVALGAWRGPPSGEVAAAAGATLAGFAVSLMQSWVYSAGNIAMLSFWVLAGLTVAAAARGAPVAEQAPAVERPQPRARGGRTVKRLAVYGAVAAAALAGLAAVGRAERARWIEQERAGMEEVVAAIGGRFLTRTVVDIWDDGVRLGISCVRYHVGDDPYAIQACFDPRGRLIETFDERSGKVVMRDLHVEPDASGIRIDPETFRKLRTYVRTTQDEIDRARARARGIRELREAQAPDN